MAKKEKEGAAASKWDHKAGRLFTHYPAVDRLHFTADGQAFFMENDARNHAETLKDKTVETINRNA
jgi:hypothetical protein